MEPHHADGLLFGRSKGLLCQLHRDARRRLFHRRPDELPRRITSKPVPNYSHRQSAGARVSSSAPARLQRVHRRRRWREQDSLPRNAAQLAKLWETYGHPATDCFWWSIDSSRRHVDPTSGQHPVKIAGQKGWTEECREPHISSPEAVFHDTS